MIQVDKYLWRGPRPKDMISLYEAGFRRIIDLESGAYEAVTEDQYEIDKKMGRYPIEIIDFDLSNVFPPKLSLVRKILTKIRNSQFEKKTYIHCLKGKDRTGYICAAYNMTYLGYNYAAASTEMKLLGFNNLLYFWWTWFLKKYEIR